jgi:hypothetical protein
MERVKEAGRGDHIGVGLREDKANEGEEGEGRVHRRVVRTHLGMGTCSACSMSTIYPPSLSR